MQYTTEQLVDVKQNGVKERAVRLTKAVTPFLADFSGETIKSCFQSPLLQFALEGLAPVNSCTIPTNEAKVPAAS